MNNFYDNLIKLIDFCQLKMIFFHDFNFYLNPENKKLFKFKKKNNAKILISFNLFY